VFAVWVDEELNEIWILIICSGDPMDRRCRLNVYTYVRDRGHRHGLKEKHKD